MAEQKDIEKENLEYIAEAAAKKFYEQFSKAKVESTININFGSASVEEISKQLAKTIQKSAGAAMGGCYSEKPCNPPKQIKKNELIKEIHDAVIESLAHGITIDLDVPSASCKIEYPAGAAEKAAKSVIEKYFGIIQVVD